MLLRVFRLAEMVPSQIAVCPTRIIGYFAKTQVSGCAFWKHPTLKEPADSFSKLSGKCNESLQEMNLRARPLVDGNLEKRFSRQARPASYSCAGEVMMSSLRTRQHFQLIPLLGCSSTNKCSYSSALVGTTSLHFVTSKTSVPSLKNISVVQRAKQVLALNGKITVPATSREQILQKQAKKQMDTNNGRHENCPSGILNLHRMGSEEHFQKILSGRKHLSCEMISICREVSMPLPMVVDVRTKGVMSTENIITQLLTRTSWTMTRVKSVQPLTDGNTLHKFGEFYMSEALSAISADVHVKQIKIQRSAEKNIEPTEENCTSKDDQPDRKRRRGRRARGRKNRDRQHSLQGDSEIDGQKSMDGYASCGKSKNVTAHEKEGNDDLKCGDTDHQTHPGSGISRKDRAGAGEPQFRKHYGNQNLIRNENVISLPKVSQQRVERITCHASKRSDSYGTGHSHSQKYDDKDQRGQVGDGRFVLNDNTGQARSGENGKKGKQLSKLQTHSISSSRKSPQLRSQESYRTKYSNTKSQSLKCSSNDQSVKDATTSETVADGNYTDGKRRKRGGRRRAGENQQKKQSSSFTPQNVESDQYHQIHNSNIKGEQENEENAGSSKKRKRGRRGRGGGRKDNPNTPPPSEMS